MSVTKDIVSARPGRNSFQLSSHSLPSYIHRRICRKCDSPFVPNRPYYRFCFPCHQDMTEFTESFPSLDESRNTYRSNDPFWTNRSTDHSAHLPIRRRDYKPISSHHYHSHPHSHSRSKNCQDCGESFILLNRKHYLCVPCHKEMLVRDSKICIICEKSYLPKDYPNHVFKNDPDKDKKCSSCWGKECLKFRCCEGTYISYPSVDRISRCGTCEDTHTNLMNRSISPRLIHDDYIIQITYDVHDVTHLGCCSDLHDVIEENYIETKNLPLLRQFNDTHYDEEGIVTGGPLEFYMESYKYSPGCCGVSHNLVKAQIIPIMVLPQLQAYVEL